MWETSHFKDSWKEQPELSNHLSLVPWDECHNKIIIRQVHFLNFSSHLILISQSWTTLLQCLSCLQHLQMSLRSTIIFLNILTFLKTNHLEDDSSIFLQELITNAKQDWNLLWYQFVIHLVSKWAQRTMKRCNIDD